MTTVMATICARGGSKGVPRKNVRPFCGKPLIDYTIEQALSCGVFDFVAVSSDDEDILSCAAKHDGVEIVRRPDALAADDTPKLPVIRHAVEDVEHRHGVSVDVVVDLAVTAPLRDASDIRGAVNLLTGTPDTDAVLSGHATSVSPFFNIVETNDQGLIHISKDVGDAALCRQTIPVCHALNGAVYVWTRQSLFSDGNSALKPRTRLYEMPTERSFDIDTPLDFEIAEFVMSKTRA